MFQILPKKRVPPVCVVSWKRDVGESQCYVLSLTFVHPHRGPEALLCWPRGSFWEGLFFYCPFWEGPPFCDGPFGRLRVDPPVFASTEQLWINHPIAVEDDVFRVHYEVFPGFCWYLFLRVVYLTRLNPNEF